MLTVGKLVNKLENLNYEYQVKPIYLNSGAYAFAIPKDLEVKKDINNIELRTYFNNRDVTVITVEELRHKLNKYSKDLVVNASVSNFKDLKPHLIEEELKTFDKNLFKVAAFEYDRLTTFDLDEEDYVLLQSVPKM
tara:strand:+ start:9291 stop:9698 length:408 start_codon:yes stop_codon:yes gene_type:complete